MDQGEPAPVRLGRYTVEEHLGHGTYGTVYRCWDPTIGRPVAVKKLRLLGPARTQVIGEVRACASIDHPSIVKVYDADSENGLIVMEYVGGGTLEDRLVADRGWVRANFTRLFIELGEGLRAAHVQRILHRDIKPANILLTGDGRPKLADFGVARTIGTNEVAMSRAGSPAYMAPEVVFGLEYGLEADIHSLGCVMYEAWIGRLPFAQPGNSIALALQKQQRVIVSLREADPQVDDILNELVNGMLAPAGERISSIEVVLEQLRHRDPSAVPGGASSIDEMQYRVGAIYGLRNRSRSPLLLLGRFQVAVRTIIAGLRHQDDDYHRRRVEAALVRAFAWLCAVSSSVNAKLSQLIWLKFDGRCPYCEDEECHCPSLDRKHDPERNRELLAKLHDRRLGQAGSPRTFAQYQAMFRRIYGQANREAGVAEVGLHTFSEIAEATDALLHLTSLKDTVQVTVLHLELSDLVAWFFALVNVYRPDYSFVDHFDRQFAEGCFACHQAPCGCPSIEHELRLASWREF
jgi:serine/threonine protein kinase